MLVSATEPEENIPDYPPIDRLLTRLRELPHAVLVDAGRGNAEFLGDNLARRRLVPFFRAEGVRRMTTSGDVCA